MAKSRRTEKQQLMREYELSLQLERELAEQQQKLEAEAEYLSFLQRLDYEVYLEEAERHLSESKLNDFYDLCACDYDILYDLCDSDYDDLYGYDD